MIESYVNGRDLYAVIASQVYHNRYEDNLEFDSEGKINPEGKRRRTNMKSLLLGIMYGRGVPSIAEQIKTHSGEVTKEDIKEAQSIQDGFFKAFPKVKDWVDKTQKEAKEKGYVEDSWGRRRRLPEIQLERYEVKFSSEHKNNNFNPLLGSKGLFSNQGAKLLEEYRQQATKTRSKKDMDALRAKALQDGIIIKDNGGFISQAERQCVNSRVQGGAASMSKKAMIAVHNDKTLKDLGFRLLIVVHDELIGECPEENVEEVQKRMSYLMLEAAKPECVVPMKCDVGSFTHWYEDVYSSDLKEEFDGLLKTKSKEEAFNIIKNEKIECTEEQLKTMLQGML